MSESGARHPSLPCLWVAPRAGGVGAAVGSWRASRGGSLTEPLQYVVSVYIKNNKSLQIFITMSCAEERVLCIQKWKAAPRQLPISDGDWICRAIDMAGQEPAAGGREQCCPGSSRR